MKGENAFTHCTHLGAIYHEAGSRNTRMKVLVLTLKTFPAHWGSSCEGRVDPTSRVCARTAGAWTQQRSLMNSLLWKKVLVLRSGPGQLEPHVVASDPAAALTVSACWPSAPNKYPSVYGAHGKQS